MIIKRVKRNLITKVNLAEVDDIHIRLRYRKFKSYPRSEQPYVITIALEQDFKKESSQDKKSLS